MQQQAPDLAIGFMLLKPDQIKREQHLSMTPNGNDAWEGNEGGGGGITFILATTLCFLPRENYIKQCNQFIKCA